MPQCVCQHRCLPPHVLPFNPIPSPCMPFWMYARRFGRILRFFECDGHAACAGCHGCRRGCRKHGQPKATTGEAAADPPHAAVSLRSATPSSLPVSLTAARRHYSHLIRGNDRSGAYLSRQDVYMHGRRAHLRPGPASGLKNLLLAGIRTATLRLHPPYLYIFWASWP